MYREKYIKYKMKYLRLLNRSGQRGGARKDDISASQGHETKSQGRPFAEPGSASSAIKRYKPPISESTYREPPVIHARDTPLMKLLFPDGFSTSLDSDDIKNGLNKFKLFFINEDKVTDVIVALETIPDSAKLGMLDINIKEIISTFDKMKTHIDTLEKKVYPEKTMVYDYLARLYNEKWLLENGK